MTFEQFAAIVRDWASRLTPGQVRSGAESLRRQVYISDLPDAQMSAFGREAEIICSIRALPVVTQSGHKPDRKYRSAAISPHKSVLSFEQHHRGCLFGNSDFFRSVALILIKANFARRGAQLHQDSQKATGEVSMAETTKLSVEKALEKLRGGDEPKSKSVRLDEKIDELEEDIKRMRAQRLRLERHQRRSTKPD